MNILIVDDDPTTLECLTEAVRMYGHTPYPCATVEDAVRALSYVEAVLTDGLRGRCAEVTLHSAESDYAAECRPPQRRSHPSVGPAQGARGDGEGMGCFNGRPCSGFGIAVSSLAPRFLIDESNPACGVAVPDQWRTNERTDDGRGIKS